MDPPGDSAKGQEPSTVVQDPSRPEASRERAFVLTVTVGGDKGQSVTIVPDTPGRVLLGTSDLCHLRLSDKRVSRRHAGVEYLGSCLRITDLDSTNGTFVDRVRVQVADLVGGEFIRLGASVIRVDEKAPPENASPPLLGGFGKVMGQSPEMRRLYPLCDRLAASEIPVLIEGETGTGKEVLAEAIHEQGPRRDGPFVVFDCTAFPPQLMEAELFGHEKGAFTGANASRRGLFQEAEGGTLFIDEIGDLELSLQTRLLRAIDRAEVRPVGSNRFVQVNVRILAATRRNLDKQVELGRFRDDLFHRMAVGRIELPPLRHRRGDIPTLARLFWKKLGGPTDAIPSDVLQMWEESAWPGNVRELRNAVARRLALGDLERPWLGSDETTDTEPQGVMPDFLDALVLSGVSFPEARERVIQEFEQRYVGAVLKKHGGNVSRASAASGIGRRYFQKLKARKK